MAWIALTAPWADEIGVVAHELGLHDLAVEDALKGHQRSKLETYGDAFSVVVRSAAYVDDDEIFGGSAGPSLSRRIYELHREVISFHRAVHPLAEVLSGLTDGAAAGRGELRAERADQEAFRVGRDPFALGLMGALGYSLFLVFKRSRWL